MTSVSTLLGEIRDIGVDRTRGGYSRAGYTDVDRDLREWFVSHAVARGLDVERDGNGIVWAWWRTANNSQAPAIATGSHLDSVPGGGEYDGPLGVASALVAVDVLRARGITPQRPLAIAVFPEEEGSRFGVACLGSRLATGVITPDRALALADVEGVTFADAMRRDGLDPRWLGDRMHLDRVGEFVELHVEQGRGLIDLGAPVGIGTSIIGHGRWRLTFAGQANHAGTTEMSDRRDPMVAAAGAVVMVRQLAAEVAGARATVGRLVPLPGGTNVIASRVDMWLDVRHADDAITRSLVDLIAEAAAVSADREGCSVQMTEESFGPGVDFDSGLRVSASQTLTGAPELATGAGHDAGILAAVMPTAMLFVRNPTGVSHSPEELCETADAEEGARALADVLASRAAEPS